MQEITLLRRDKTCTLYQSSHNWTWQFIQIPNSMDFKRLISISKSFYNQGTYVPVLCFDILHWIHYFVEPGVGCVGWKLGAIFTLTNFSLMENEVFDQQLLPPWWNYHTKWDCNSGLQAATFFFKSQIPSNSREISIFQYHQLLEEVPNSARTFYTLPIAIICQPFYRKVE